MKTVNIYTDGACSGNQNENNIGGWGAVLEFNGVTKELNGGEINTTNNRMELMALIKALSVLKEKGLFLNIYSDSSYLINCFKNGWIDNWQKNGWKTAGKKPVENQELWLSLLDLLSEQSASFYLVKGHLPSTKLDPSEAAANKTLQDSFANFRKHNGDGFSFERFLEISKFNNRCDDLANVFVNENRK